MKDNKVRNSGLLFLTAVIWGMAFVSQSKGMDFMGPLTFNGVRCIIGASALLIYIAFRRKTTQIKKKTNWKLTLWVGFFCGLIMTIASTLQQIGVQYTTVGKAGFITTLYIIFVPLFGFFLGEKPVPVLWISTIMAAIGMYLLCITESLHIQKGDIYILICAISFAIHIMVIDKYVNQVDGVVVSCLQFFICGIICCIFAYIFEEPSFLNIKEGIGSLFYAGAISCGVGYTLQIVGQKGVNKTVAALILSLEAVVSAIGGFVAYKIGFLTTDQSLTPQQILGCVIVFAAVVLVQLPQDWFQKKKILVDNCQ